jgi:Protein of unknown function (DUF2844)
MQPTVGFKQIVLLIVAVPSIAFAALGEAQDSVQADQLTMKATRRVASVNKAYTVHEIRSPSGTMIREYVSNEGAVFAVAWNGPVMPDLRQILGKYFETYAQTAKIKHAGHNHLTIQQTGLVVHSGGHIRAFTGHAYVPALLPQGVSVANIQ